MRSSADLVSILPAVQKTLDAVSPSVEMAKKKYIEAHDLVVVSSAVSLWSQSCASTFREMKLGSVSMAAFTHGSSFIHR